MKEKQQKIHALFLIVVLISFLGFCVENIWLILIRGYIDNRSMGLPFLLGYGLAMLAAYLLLGTPEELRFGRRLVSLKTLRAKRAAYFFMAMLCISVGEILLGTFVETFFHFVWWDFSALPFNITPYTTIPTSAIFAGLMLLFMDRFFQPLCRCFMSWKPTTLRLVSRFLLFLVVGDFLRSIWLMYTKKGMIRNWKLRLLPTGLLHYLGAH